ncbi:hypothetical protein SAMN05444920_13257 [Nonomuraea solani]|uniref:NmrA-like family protein n=1 Tax=Nonomuraea solani TaxID=1144553 RepID=A0A1H6EYR5_9ACTN|nr:hypothetical protein [Nonomuraea solani]SEH03048.1 hypothetical protein SAMN05444920_13257 [Nonomuraea solani]
MSGARALTFAEAVAIIARSAGRSIEYVELSPEQYKDELLAEGWPEAVADALNTMFALRRSGRVSVPADGVQQVLGREPIAFEDYVTRVAATGAWS